MTWWVLTYLSNDRAQTSLSVLAQTTHRAHLFMAWATVKPARQPIYRIIRGKRVFCGYKYIWDSPNLVEQTQPLDTFLHTFVTTPLLPHHHVWLFLFSSKTLYQRYCQSALFHVFPPKIKMASARIFHATDQPCPINTLHIVQFDSVLWDDYNFFDPAAPDRFTIPAGALYTFGANLSLETAASGKASLDILRNGGPSVIRHDHLIEDTGWAGATLSLQTDMPLNPSDFLQLQVYYTGVGARDIMAYPNFSPHFWIRLVGAYPI